MKRPAKLVRTFRRWTKQVGAALRPRSDDRGITYIEIAFMMLIVTIALVSLTTALRTASRGSLMAKERNRAQSIARDRIEEVKHLGYEDLTRKASNYLYPDQPDPSNPLYQRLDVLPYPTVKPVPTDEDPWTPEMILLGGITYWRHVVVKFVTESGPGAQLAQEKPPCPTCSPAEPGGTGTYSNLAFIEVDVTWFSRRSGRTEQMRVTTLLANTTESNIAVGALSGTLLDDDIDNNGVDGGGTVALPAVAGSDDRAITWASLTVIARDVLTNQTYTTSSLLGTGSYAIQNLPYGSYILEMRGAPTYADSAYNGYTSPSSLTYPPITVEVTAGTPEVGGLDIRTNKVRPVTVHAKFNLPAPGGSLASPHQIRISANDGLSNPVTFFTYSPCGTGGFPPCQADLPGVAWPTQGYLWYWVWLEDLTAGTIVTTTLCMDSTSTPSDFWVGDDPSLHPGTNTCGSGCTSTPPPGSLSCAAPPWTSGPVLVSGGSFTPAHVRVKVQEYYNLASQNVATPSLVRISMLAQANGVSVTLGLDSATSATIFEVSPGLGLVPLEGPGTITFTAKMTTTGWTTDSFTLPFPTDSANKYDLEVAGNGYAPPTSPDPDKRHTFVLTRVSSISGHVWKSTSGTPFPGAAVRIHNTASQWSNVITCDSKGVFTHTAIPVEVSSYTINPVLGSDYASNPVSRDRTVNTNGLALTTDDSNNPLDFTLTAINGFLVGTVRDSAGKPYASGVVVIASTYNGAFPTSIPSGALSGAYTYSTVTETDGTYRLKVATGVGTYQFYAYAMKDGSMHQVGPVAAPPVLPDVDTPADVTLP